MNELEEYFSWDGEIISGAYSRFKYENNSIIQTVIMPNGKDFFYYQVFLFADIGSEYFLRFDKVSRSNDWLTIFNSASFVRKSFVKEPQDLRGSNYYPINSALAVDLNGKSLIFYPGFSLGAGMPDRDHFEIHLHRHPNNVDDLGITEYVGDHLPADHKWMVSIQKFNYSNIWRDYLANKHPISKFYLESLTSLTESFQNSSTFYNSLQLESSPQLLPDDECNYISRVFFREDSIFDVINICEYPTNPGIFGNSKQERTGLLTKNEPKVLRSRGSIQFFKENLTTLNVLKYPQVQIEGLISPFDLKTFARYNENYYPEDPGFLSVLIISNNADSRIIAVVVWSSLGIIASGLLIKFLKKRKVSDKEN